MLATWGSTGGGGSAPVTGTPALDTNASSKQYVIYSSGSTTPLPAVTTNQSPDIILVLVAYEYTTLTPTVSSVTATGLSFTKRGSILNPNVGSHGMTIELWSAPAAATLSAKVITVTWSSAIDDAVACTWAVSSTYTVPFDPNVGLPSTSTANGSSPPTTTFSTTKSDDMLFFATFSPNSTQPDTSDPAGWTLIFARGVLNNGGGANFCRGAVWYKSVSAPQSSATVQATSGGTTYWCNYVDAVTGDS